MMESEHETLNTSVASVCCGVFSVVVDGGSCGSSGLPSHGAQLSHPAGIICLDDGNVASLELPGRGRRLNTADFIGSNRVLCIRRRLYSFRRLQEASLCSILRHPSVRMDSSPRIGVLDPVTSDVLLFGNFSLMTEDELLHIPRVTASAYSVEEQMGSRQVSTKTFSEFPNVYSEENSLEPISFAHKRAMQALSSHQLCTRRDGYWEVREANAKGASEELSCEFAAEDPSGGYTETEQKAPAVMYAAREASVIEEANREQAGVLTFQRVTNEDIGSSVCLELEERTELLRSQPEKKHATMAENIKHLALIRKVSHSQLQLWKPSTLGKGLTFELDFSARLKESYPFAERITSFSCDLLSTLISKANCSASNVLQDVYALCERYQYLIHRDTNLEDAYRHLQLFRAHTATCQVLDKAREIIPAPSMTSLQSKPNRRKVNDSLCSPGIKMRSSKNPKKAERGQVSASLRSQVERKLSRRSGKRQRNAKQGHSLKTPADISEAKGASKKSDRRKFPLLQGTGSPGNTRLSAKSTDVWKKTTKINRTEVPYTFNALRSNEPFFRARARLKSGGAVAGGDSLQAHSLETRVTSKASKLHSQKAQPIQVRSFSRQLSKSQELMLSSKWKSLVLQSGPSTSVATAGRKDTTVTADSDLETAYEYNAAFSLPSRRLA